MKISRMTATAALGSVLVLSACTGSDADDPTTTSSSTQAAPTTSDAATDTAGATEDGAGDDAAVTSEGATDAAGGTEAPGDDASQTEVAMTTDEQSAVMSVEEAEQVATATLQRRFDAFSAEGHDRVVAQRESLMGSARDAAEAADRLIDVQGPAAEADDAEMAAPNVLAISREDGALPQFLLVQTVPEDGTPILHLMECRTGDPEDFRIIWEAPMLGGTELPTFDRRSVGSEVIRGNEKADLAKAPRDIIKALAADLNFPQSEETSGYETNGYSDAVREAAQGQADAVAAQADLEEKNWLVSDDTKVLRFEDGSAFVMGTLIRHTVFDVKANGVLTPPDSFQVFAGDSELTDEATQRTMVFVGLHAPVGEGTTELIAAREQIVDAYGS